MIKFVHTADWQLGMTRYFLKGEAQARFDGARIDAIRTIGKVAEEESCDFVVVCGDVFESNQVNSQVILRALEAMRSTPTITYYLLPGNHDPLDAASVYASASFKEHKPGNVTVLRDSNPLPVGGGVELVPAPWFTKRPLTDLVAEVCEPLTKTGALRIVVGHGATDSLSPDQSNPSLISLAALEQSIGAGHVHYVALGDRHSTTDVGSSGRVWYSGAPEPTNYRETDPGNILIVSLEAQDIEVEKRAVGQWRFHQVERHLSSDTDIDALDNWLSAIEDKERTIVKLALVGQVSLANNAKLNELLDRYGQLFAALQKWDRHSELVVIPDDQDYRALGLSGFAQDALNKLVAVAESNDEKAVDAREALALLHRLVRSTK